MIGEGFEHLDEAWTQSRKVMDLAMKALAGITTGGCAAICPLLRIEIFRDFSQSTSLFFSNMYNDIAASPILAWVKTLFGVSWCSCYRSCEFGLVDSIDLGSDKLDLLGSQRRSA